MRFAKQIAWVCILLIFGSAIAFAAHHHADGDDGTCAVCVLAHSASPTASTLSLATTFLKVATVRLAPVAAAKQRLIAFALTVRPPPEA